MLLWSSSANSADLLPAPSAVLYRQMHSGDSRHSTLILSSGTEFKSALIWLDVADLVLRLMSSQFAKLVEKCDENCSFPLLHGLQYGGFQSMGFTLWDSSYEFYTVRFTLRDPHYEIHIMRSISLDLHCESITQPKRISTISSHVDTVDLRRKFFLVETR